MGVVRTTGNGSWRARLAVSSLATVTFLAAFSASRAGTAPAPSWTGEGNQSNAQFGFDVSVAGDVNGDGFSDLIVGARLYDGGQSNEGRALVYLGGASGPEVAASWISEQDQALSFYGSSVAAAGDVNGDGFGDVIVGAQSYDMGESNEGAAFLYLGSSTGLDSVAAWTGEGNQILAVFGFSVGTAGDVNGDGYDDVIVGARGHDGAEADAGKAYVYHGSADGLSTTAAWSADVSQEDAAFGGAVATAGDVNGDGYDDVIVGAFLQDDPEVDEGKAFVYLGSATGLQSTPVWSAGSDRAGASFGWSVSTAGDVNGDGYADVIVGARDYDSALFGVGKAYVFCGNATGVDSLPCWTFEGDQTNGHVGWSVSTAGDVNGDGFADVVVGGYRTDESFADEGKAWIFLGGKSGLDSSAAWSAVGGQGSAFFGQSVSGAGDVDADGFGDVLVGASSFDNPQANEGAAFFFCGGPELPEIDASWIARGGVQSTAYGSRVSFAGDVNGDGLSDVLVADPLFTATAAGEGRVDLFLGLASGPETSPDWIVTGGQTSASMGRSATRAGDFNGDGYDDVVVGAPFFDAGFGNEGKAELYLGSSLGLAAVPIWGGLGGELASFFGIAAAGAGDLDADGFADFAVGASFANQGGLDRGAVYVYFGNVSFPSNPAVLAGLGDGDELGASIAGAGDVNGDGFSDLLVGSPGASRALLYYGSAAGVPSVASWSYDDPQSSSRFGSHVATAGDVNGDGFSDIVVGAPESNFGEVDEGAIHVFLGSPSGLASAPDWTYDSDIVEGILSVAEACGDLNGDGFGDLLVGMDRFTGTETWEGRAFVLAGSADGPTDEVLWEREGGLLAAQFGSSVAGRGDVDGDGFADLLVGARGFADSLGSGGATFLSLGNAGGGVSRALRAETETGSTPIALLGASDSQTSFRITGWARTPAGRGAVTPEFEVVPAAQALGGSGVLSTTLDTGLPVVGEGSRASISFSVDGLTATTPHKWRVRFRSSSPFFGSSPWFTPVGNAIGETDLRTAPGPVAAPTAALSETGALRAKPSPFRGATAVELSVARTAWVRVSIHDVSGRRVATLLDQEVFAGSLELLWDGRDASGEVVSSGIYWVRAQVGSETVTTKVVRLR